MNQRCNKSSLGSVLGRMFFLISINDLSKDFHYWNSPAPPLYLKEEWGLQKLAKISKDFVKKEGIIKYGGFKRTTDAWFFYCLKYKADVTILYLLAKLELRTSLLITSLFFPDFYPCLLKRVLVKCGSLGAIFWLLHRLQYTKNFTEKWVKLQK